MSRQLLFIHGGSAYSRYDDFLEHLKSVPLERVLQTNTKRWSDDLRLLHREGFEVYMPSMPNAQNAKYEEWRIWFERHFEILQDEVVLIGWSLGAYFLLRYLVERDLPFSPKSLFLIASPYTTEGLEGDDCADFTFDPVLLGEVEKKASDIHIFHSTDDFVVPYEHALKLKEAIPLAQLHTFEDRNHFLQPEFPELIELIKAGAKP